MVISQEKGCPMVIRAASEMQASGPVMDRTVAVRFQRSAAAVGPGAGDCAEVGAVSGADNELPQPTRMAVSATKAAAIRVLRAMILVLLSRDRAKADTNGSTRRWKACDSSSEDLILWTHEDSIYGFRAFCRGE